MVAGQAGIAGQSAVSLAEKELITLSSPALIRTLEMVETDARGNIPMIFLMFNTKKEALFAMKKTAQVKYYPNFSILNNIDYSFYIMRLTYVCPL